MLVGVEYEGQCFKETILLCCKFYDDFFFVYDYMVIVDYRKPG